MSVPEQKYLLKEQIIIATLRISMGTVFLWAFFDKLFGLGFATTPEKSWLAGNSPTSGFLLFATRGPLKPYFEGLAGNPLADWLFMMGLFGIGIALIFGIAKYVSTFFGSLLLFLMYLALLPPVNNPLIDDHIIYILVLQLLLRLHSGEVFGLAKWWAATPLVKKLPFMK